MTTRPRIRGEEEQEEEDDDDCCCPCSRHVGHCESRYYDYGHMAKSDAAINAASGCC